MRVEMRKNRGMDTPEAEVTAVAADIARQLNETNPGAVAQIQRIVMHLGATRAYAFLQETLAREAAGGVWTTNRSRRRTPGGTYFFLIRGQITQEEHQTIWPQHLYPGTKSPETRQRIHRPKYEFPPVYWAERISAATAALENPTGEAYTMKITVIGRPGKIIERDSFVVTPLASVKAPPLPKGLPMTPEEPTVFLVYIAKKQWRKVAAAITDPEDKLIVEGYPVNDKKLGVIAVMTQNVTTIKLQRAQRMAENPT